MLRIPYGDVPYHLEWLGENQIREDALSERKSAHEGGSSAEYFIYHT